MTKVKITAYSISFLLVSSLTGMEEKQQIVPVAIEQKPITTACSPLVSKYKEISADLANSVERIIYAHHNGQKAQNPAIEHLKFLHQDLSSDPELSDYPDEIAALNDFTFLRIFTAQQTLAHLKKMDVARADLEQYQSNLNRLSALHQIISLHKEVIAKYRSASSSKKSS